MTGPASSEETAYKRCPMASGEEGTAPPQQVYPDRAAGPGWQGPWLQMLGTRRGAWEALRWDTRLGIAAGEAAASVQHGARQPMQAKHRTAM